MSNNQFVYKVYDQDEVVYVGITDNISRRIKEHAVGSWYKEEFSVKHAEMPDRGAAKMLETYLIKQLHPTFNKAENNGLPASFIRIDNSKIKWNDLCDEKVREKTFRNEKKSSCNDKRNKGNIVRVRDEDYVRLKATKDATKLSYSEILSQAVEMFRLQLPKHQRDQVDTIVNQKR